MADRLRVLLLGGTAEAAVFARRLAAESAIDLTTSLAGATRAPAPLPGHVRHGGFGGADGLAAYLGENRIDVLVDATHPYASAISAHAQLAAGAAGVPCLRFERPPWEAVAGDRWTEVADAAAAAALLPAAGARAFVTLGTRALAPFAARPGLWCLIRLIEPPEEPLQLPAHEVVVARGPFARDGEVELLRRHRIDVVVSRNSGGASGYAKVEAARELGIPVLVLARPAAAGPAAASEPGQIVERVLALAG